MLTTDVALSLHFHRNPFDTLCIRRRPEGVTPLATTTRTATITLPGENDDIPDPIDSALRIVTETVTLTQAVEAAPYTLTERVTVTVPAAVVVPVPVTRTTTSTFTSISRAAPTPNNGGAVVDNGQGRGDAAQAQETGIPFDYTCRPGDAGQKYPGGMSLSATDNQRTTLCEQSVRAEFRRVLLRC